MGRIAARIGFWRRMLFGNASDRISSLEKRVDALESLLRCSVDITKVPKAKGQLRLLQRADTALLKLVADALDRARLQYWLDCGTLLGAVRHGGFVPWDDDVDLGMMREDCARAESVLAKEFPVESGFKVVRSNAIRIGLVGTPCQIDIFPYDFAGLPSRSVESVEAYMLQKEKLSRSVNFDWDRLATDWKVIGDDEPSVWDAKAENFHSHFDGKEILVSYGFEAGMRTRFSLWKEDMFPLSCVEFEGLRLYAPRSPDVWLRGFYGDYMAFPREMRIHEDIRARFSGGVAEKMMALIEKTGISEDM